ncbi:MAG: type IV pilus modification protein PilV, partial [Rhizobacter sp.]
MNTLTHHLPAGSGHRPPRTGRPARYGCKSQLGSTLIEALVAMLVLSVGLLGIAGLASASLRYSQGAWARAAVASGLSDLADRVRSNPTASITDYRFNATSYANQRIAFDDGDLAIALDCLTNVCTPTQLATYQLTDWRNTVNRSMPGAAVWVSGTR